MFATDDFHSATTQGIRATGVRMCVTCDGIAATAQFPGVMIRKNSATIDRISATPRKKCVTGDKKCVTGRKKPVTPRKKPAQLDTNRVEIRADQAHLRANCVHITKSARSALAPQSSHFMDAPQLLRLGIEFVNCWNIIFYVALALRQIFRIQAAEGANSSLDVGC